MMISKLLYKKKRDSTIWKVSWISFPEPRPGLEPGTFSLRMKCSTDWAILATRASLRNCECKFGKNFPNFRQKLPFFFAEPCVDRINYWLPEAYAIHQSWPTIRKGKGRNTAPSRIRTDTPGHAIRNVKVAPLSQANSANASDRYLPRRLCNSSGSSVVM